jgi:DUF1680 family protein
MMQPMVRAWLVGLYLGGVLSPAAAAETSLTATPFSSVHITDSFWSPRIRTNRTATIEANLRQCEITGRIKNFAVAGKLEPGKHQGLLYDDSDLYKVLEGIAYTLADHRDADLEKRTDAIIDKIAAAQQPDGYLNTYYTLVKPEERWKNIQHGHELYCSGHLIEAAVAYYQATGKRKLLDVACRLADHIGTVFGPDRRHEATGHEELELALIKLYRVTKNPKYRDLAQFFLDMRGRADGRRLFGEYAQDHKPIREQTEVAGHAVRAMYLYCGMADMTGLTSEQALRTAMERIWHDVVDRKMYVTGGIGPSAHNEGFTVPYDLPNDSAYAETCAAIGMALWNHRLFLMSGDGKYADVLEREVYNGLLSGVSLSGDRFFYVNPLGSKGGHHRVPWFDCSCCPTNLVRYIPGMGERVYAQRGNALWTVLYLASTATLTLDGGKVQLAQQTRYPWEGDVEITLTPQKEFEFELNLRIPGWQQGKPTVSINGKALDEVKPSKGYVSLKRLWKAGDVVRLSLPMPVQRVYAHPMVKADEGRVALQRGPVVYCLEGVDNAGQARNLVLPREARLDSHFDKDLLGGVVVVTGEAQAVSRGEDEKLHTKPVSFRAVPYYSWDNRQAGPMVVWLPERPEGTDAAGQTGVGFQASHLNPTDTLSDLGDGVTPRASNDRAIRRMTWWDHKGGAEWLSHRFPQTRTVAATSVYWFDDTGIGACRIPAEWRLLWRDGNEWKPVELTGEAVYGTALNQFNAITFKPVTTRELKLEVKLQKDYSGGVLKWVIPEK